MGVMLLPCRTLFLRPSAHLGMRTGYRQIPVGFKYSPQTKTRAVVTRKPAKKALSVPHAEHARRDIRRPRQCRHADVALVDPTCHSRACAALSHLTRDQPRKCSKQQCIMALSLVDVRKGGLAEPRQYSPSPTQAKGSWRLHQGGPACRASGKT